MGDAVRVRDAWRDGWDAGYAQAEKDLAERVTGATTPRPKSATTAPLNNTRALLPPDMLAQRDRALDSLSRPRPITDDRPVGATPPPEPPADERCDFAYGDWSHCGFSRCDHVRFGIESHHFVAPSVTRGDETGDRS